MTVTATITGAATKGENKAAAQLFAADMDTDISLQDDHGSGATADVGISVWGYIL